MDWTPYDTTLIGRWRTFSLRQIARLAGLLGRREYEKSRIVRTYAAFAERCLGIVSRDTGWRIACQTRAGDLHSVLFDCVPPDQTNLAPPGAEQAFEELAREYELYYYDKEPILTHKYGTGNLPWRTSRGGDETYWRQCIQAFENAL